MANSTEPTFGSLQTSSNTARFRSPSVNTLVVRSTGLSTNPNAGARAVSAARSPASKVASFSPALPTRSAASDAVPPENE